jgi:hypothetical protein
MARTTAAEVKEILETEISDALVNAYIASANRIVTEHLTDLGYGDEKLEDIEMWLSAHLIAITRERQTTQEKLGDAAVAYANVFGKGLEASTYGQMVAMLDTEGVLKSLGKERIVFKAIKSFS